MNRGVEPQRGKEKDGGKVSEVKGGKTLGEMRGGKEAERHPVTKKGGRVVRLRAQEPAGA